MTKLATIIIASHNGGDTLKDTMDSLMNLKAENCDFEIILVNNASVDHTQQLAEQYIDRIPLRILYEPRRGKSFALNTAIDHAKGDYLLFTDDDVTVDEGWLGGFLAAADLHPDVDLFAGQVRPRWQTPPPRWLVHLTDKGMSYGATAVSQADGLIGRGHYFKGANFMVRRSAVGTVRFDETERTNFLGGRLSIGGEDTRFAQQILANGSQGWFVSGAKVNHLVRTCEMNMRYVFTRYVRIGRVMQIRFGKPREPAALQAYRRMKLQKMRRLALACTRYFISGNKELASESMVLLARELGMFLELHRQQKTPT